MDRTLRSLFVLDGPVHGLDHGPRVEEPLTGLFGLLVQKNHRQGISVLGYLIASPNSGSRLMILRNVRGDHAMMLVLYISAVALLSLAFVPDLSL